MLREGRTIREVLTVAERVYGPFENVYARQAAYLNCLGVLRGRTWGDAGRAEEIKAVAREVVK